MTSLKASEWSAFGGFLQDFSRELREDRIRRQQAQGWSQYDARRNLITSFNAKIHPMIILAELMVGQVLKDPFWETTNPLSEEERSEEITLLDRFLKGALLLQTFSQVEAGLRVILRFKDPVACNNARGAAYDVFGAILDRYAVEVPEDAKTLLNLMREVRNTIHNDWRYFPSNNRDLEIEYRGRKYHFREGKVLDFVTIGFIENMLKDLRELIIGVVDSPEIRDCSDMDIDPADL